METPEGEIIDGPYKNKKEFDRALALYIKQYKYSPVVVERDITQPESEKLNGSIEEEPHPENLPEGA